MPPDTAPVLKTLDAATRSVPWSRQIACHLLFNLASALNRPQILELACGYGKSTVYLAAAARERGGHVLSVDHEHPTWNGRTAADLVEAVGATEWCTITFNTDARWYLLELFTSRPGEWVDLAFVDASHSVEVDSFLALATWTHLRPGGVLVFDDLDWTVEQHPSEFSARSRPSIPHVRKIYDYLRRASDVDEATEWGFVEQEWAWGLIRKRRPRACPGRGMTELLDSIAPHALNRGELNGWLQPPRRTSGMVSRANSSGRRNTAYE